MSKSKQLNITDFRYGLDSRRSELTSRTGVLLRCQNGSITQGAEVRKRMAFVKSSLLPGCYGLAVSLQGFITFGSGALPAGMVAYPAYNGYLGAGMPQVSYMQLTSPLGSAMTAVLTSIASFNNKPFVLATFGADGTFVFYDGVLVPDFTSGLVLTGQLTNAEQATALMNLVNETTNYTATINPATPTVVAISGINGNTYASTETVTTANSGALAVNELNQAQPAIAGAQAVGSFELTAGVVGTGATLAYVGFVWIGTNTAGHGLLSANVPFDTTVQKTAIDVAANINANSGANGGYSALANGNVISIYAPIGASINGTNIRVGCGLSSNNDGAIICGGCSFTVTASGADNLTITQIVDSNGAVDLLTATFELSTYAGNVNAWLMAIAENINVGGTGHAAIAFGNTLYLPFDGDSATLYPVAPAMLETITVDFTIVAGAPVITGVPTIRASAYPTSVVGSTAASPTGQNQPTNLVTITARGGTPFATGAPYAYQWSVGSPLFYATDPTSNSTAFALALRDYVPVASTATCTITDSTGSYVKVNIGVSFISTD